MCYHLKSKRDDILLGASHAAEINVAGQLLDGKWWIFKGKMKKKLKKLYGKSSAPKMERNEHPACVWET